MTIYITDSDMLDGAYLEKFDSKAKALKAIKQRYRPENGFTKVHLDDEFEPGDCWQKLYKLDKYNYKFGFGYIDGVKCHIRRPGTHPGLGYWCDPVAKVYRIVTKGE